MSVDEGLYAWVQEALEPVGRVTMRRMMGGATLYLHGTIFAILSGGELWLKADDQSQALWEAAGCERFSATFRNGKVGVMNYRRAPSDVYDDAEALRRWAAIAVEAGLRGATRREARAGRKT